MFRKFRLNLSILDRLDVGPIRFDQYKEFVLAEYDSQKECFRNDLIRFLGENSRLQASEIQDAWFSKVKADVFISHSHKDREIAIGLAGWLKSSFGLESFIDSCVWGNSDDLLKLVDDAYCRNKDEYLSYNYKSRNVSTSHVHMMLNTALAQMIDTCECIIFLNTPNSISLSDDVQNNISSSPWLYSEVVLTNITRISFPDRYLRKILAKADSMERLDEVVEDKGPKFDYKLKFEDYTELNSRQLNDWATRCRGKNAEVSLDFLYKTYQIK